MTNDPIPLARDFTLREVADALRVSDRWIRDRIRLDGIEHQRKGHKITFTVQQVESLRASLTAQAPVEKSITTGRKRKSA